MAGGVLLHHRLPGVDLDRWMAERAERPRHTLCAQASPLCHERLRSGRQGQFVPAVGRHAVGRRDDPDQAQGPRCRCRSARGAGAAAAAARTQGGPPGQARADGRGRGAGGRCGRRDGVVCSRRDCDHARPRSCAGALLGLLPCDFHGRRGQHGGGPHPRHHSGAGGRAR